MSHPKFTAFSENWEKQILPNHKLTNKQLKRINSGYGDFSFY